MVQAVYQGRVRERRDELREHIERLLAQAAG
jgi:hypothetical protein